MTCERILITGARGYLGGRLLQHLTRQGRSVVGATRSASTIPSGWPDSANIVELDHTRAAPLASSALANIDCVVHLAAANEWRSAADPDLAVNETGLGTRRLIEACVQAGVKRFIFLSTVHVYGAPLEGILREIAALRPIHPYAIAHQLGEAFTLAAAARGQIEGVVVRLSNGIGAPAWPSVDRWTLVGNDFALQAIDKGEILVKNPEQRRDFIVMEDVCVGLALLIDAPVARLGDGLFNIASGHSQSIGDIAKIVADLSTAHSGRPTRIVTPQTLVGESAPLFNVDIGRMLALGFVPSGPDALKRELEDTIKLVYSGRRDEAL